MKKRAKMKRCSCEADQGFIEAYENTISRQFAGITYMTAKFRCKKCGNVYISGCFVNNDGSIANFTNE